MLKVYLMKGYSLCVELPIFTTHFQSGVSGSHKAIYTKEWLELLKWIRKEPCTRKGRSTLLALVVSACAGSRPLE